jgi:hypothetical protein
MLIQNDGQDFTNMAASVVAEHCCSVGLQGEGNHVAAATNLLTNFHIDGTE